MLKCIFIPLPIRDQWKYLSLFGVGVICWEVVSQGALLGYKALGLAGAILSEPYL